MGQNDHLLNPSAKVQTIFENTKFLCDNFLFFLQIEQNNGNCLHNRKEMCNFAHVCMHVQ